MVGDFLRAHDDAFAIEADVLLEDLVGFRAQGETGARSAAQDAVAQHVEHAVLDDLGEGGQIAEPAGRQTRQHRIGNVAHAGLQRQQVGRQATLFHLVLQEFDQVRGDTLAGGIGGIERTVAIRAVGAHHRDDLVRIAAQRGVADAVVRMDQRNRLAVRRQRGAVVDVVHAVQPFGLPVVDLHDHLAGQVQPGLVVAQRGRWHQRAVLADGRGFDHRGVDRAVETEPGVLGDVAQMGVDVFQRAGVDALARVRIALERQAQGDAVDLGQRAVQFRRGRGAGEQADLEPAPFRVPALDPAGQRQRHFLGIARSGEPAHGHGLAGLDVRGGFFGGDDESAQARMADTIAGHAGGGERKTRIIAPPVRAGV